MSERYSSTQQFASHFKSNGRKSRCTMFPVSEEGEFPSSSLLDESSILFRETTMYALTRACRLLVQRVRKDQKMWSVDRDGDVVVYPRRSLHESEYRSYTTSPKRKYSSSPSFDEESVSHFPFSFTMPFPPASEKGNDAEESNDSIKVKEPSDDDSSEEFPDEKTIWKKFNVLSIVPHPSSDYSSD